MYCAPEHADTSLQAEVVMREAQDEPMLFFQASLRALRNPIGSKDQSHHAEMRLICSFGLTSSRQEHSL